MQSTIVYNCKFFVIQLTFINKKIAPSLPKKKGATIRIIQVNP